MDSEDRPWLKGISPPSLGGREALPQGVPYNAPLHFPGDRFPKDSSRDAPVISSMSCKEKRSLRFVVTVWVIVLSCTETLSQPSWNYDDQQTIEKNQEILKGLADEALASLNAGQQAPPGQGQGSGTTQSPLDMLLELAAMPKEVQISFLEGFGETLMAQTGQDCNIYGGEESCKTLPSDSEFARLCPNHDLKVDCAFYTEDMQEIQFNPVSDIKKAIEDAQEQDLENKCPECFKNQLEWFCSSIVPKCGSVRASLESSLLPAISKVVEAQNSGKSWGEALAAAMPSLVRANSLTMPCQEMCLDVMETCACGKDKTFGQLLESYSDSQTGEPLPAAFSMQLFSELKNTSFCSLYSSSSQPGFSGPCRKLSSRCSDHEGWCDPSNPAPAVSSEIMASQLADSLFGFMRYWDENSLSLVDKTAQSPGVVKKNEQYIRTGSTSGQAVPNEGSTWKGVFLGFLAAALAFGGLATGFWFYKRRQVKQRQGSSQYIAMADTESLLNES